MARCQWCTAPLPSGEATCRYCGGRSDVDLQGIHESTVARPASERICPACNVPMQSLQLRLGGTFYLERSLGKRPCDRLLSVFSWTSA